MILLVGLTLYRTFNNITKGADLSAHAFLCELDKWKKNHDDQFPEEILIQVDGASAGHFCVLKAEFSLNSGFP